jgi:hypothetical protein
MALMECTTRWGVKFYQKHHGQELFQTILEDNCKRVFTLFHKYGDHIVDENWMQWTRTQQENFNQDVLSEIPIFNNPGLKNPLLKIQSIRDFVFGCSKEKYDFMLHALRNPAEYQTGNTFLNVGINHLLNILCGNVATPLFNNANARMLVGTDNTAPGAGQTTILANAVAKGMDSGFPTSGTSQQAIFQSTFLDADAVQNMFEQCIDPGDNTKTWNRANVNLGNKPNDETWVVEGTLSIS